MKAFVIGEDQVKQYVLAILAALVLAFSLGYVLGDRSLERLVNSTPIFPVPATSEVAPENPADDTKAPENEKAEDKQQAAAEKQEAEKLAAQKKLEEKQAEEKKEAERIAAQKQAEQKKLEEKKAAAKREAEKRAAAKRAAEKKAAEAKRLAEQKAAEERKLAEQKAAAEKTAQAQEQASAATTTPQTAQAAATNRRYYSIQAGMFASKANAMSFIEELAEKNFEAHVSDFVSSSGATKYNVRVGRFEERNQARELLREFQKSFTSPAYVVITQQ